ncbi:MAG: hypothetical protein EOO14_26855 [Chitinophagaceae bacterium]|nr:MAG: hypothetical protein EOO14_26855 [Chitinophagaceae bacterium]
MAQIGKGSSKRGKPSYVMSIIGVTLVLFLLGIVGWMVINTNKLSEYFKENVEVKVYLANKVSAKDSAALMAFIASRPYIRSYEYVTKDEAKKKYLDEGNEDFSTILDFNPLPDGIYFRLKTEYVDPDSLQKVAADIKQGQSTGLVSDVSYPQELVSNMNKNFRNISLIILGIAIILSIVVIFLIDNTIRLAMFSNRFLIKTMQMVGATRQFIARPLTVPAVYCPSADGTCHYQWRHQCRHCHPADLYCNGGGREFYSLAQSGSIELHAADPFPGTDDHWHYHYVSQHLAKCIQIPAHEAG